MVDRVLFNHWRDAKFTCCMIGESCKQKESHTALCGCKGVRNMLSRLGRSCRLSNCRRDRKDDGRSSIGLEVLGL